MSLIKPQIIISGMYVVDDALQETNRHKST
jgi:hypothetical protein